MSDLAVYRLTFHSGLHVGTQGVNLEESDVVLPSDTLFAALVDAYRRTGGDPDDFVAPFPGVAGEAAPPFLVTSLFPFAGDVRFFPMLVPLQWIFSEAILKERRKEVKRIRFVSEDIFRDILAGKCLDQRLFPQDEAEEPTDGVALQGTTFWMTLEETKSLPESWQHTGRCIPPRALRRHNVYVQQNTPRVTIDRIASASTIFHAGRVSFNQGCGLWFGVDWRRPDVSVGNGSWTFRQAFEQTLVVLQDDGLGGERTAGYGAFSWKSGKTLTLHAPQADSPMLLLSRYHPRGVELPAALGPPAAYDLFAVGGWLRSWDGPAQRRKRLWFVDTGSIVCAVGPGPWGDITDVCPAYDNPQGDLPHPVWRYGLALGPAITEVKHE